MSGGKGGGSTTSVEVPEYIERAAQRNLNKAEGISQLGYVPQYGPDVAAFTPSQQSAFQNTADSANAFGMATPTSQRDIMGGMDAPTEYANGVSGYSSQPMFQQSVDQFQADRPGQFDQMSSFFIDPFTGQAGGNMNAPVNYENYNTAAQNSRNQAEAQRANELAIAQVQMNVTPPGQAASDAALDASMRAARDGGAERSGRLGDGLRGNAPSYTGLGDRLNGGGAGRSGDTYSGGGAMSDLGNSLTTSVDLPGNVVSRTLGVGAGAKNSDNASGFEGANGEGEANDGTVICTSMHTLGLISDEVYKLDAEFGKMVESNDAMMIGGYRFWATPVAEYILGSSIGSKLALSVIAPLATSWAAQMAHVMRPEEYKPNLLGKVIMFVGHPICRLVGYMSSGGSNLIKKGA